jgi:hypothetical protein
MEKGLMEENKNGASDAPKQEFKYVDMPKYDPSKKYRWEPGSNFFMTGEEFGVILNSLRAILNTPEAQKVLLAERANIAVENTIARAVQQGIVQEIQEPGDREIPKKNI